MRLNAIYLISGNTANLKQLSHPDEISEILLVNSNLSQVHKVQDRFENALLDAIHEEDRMRTGIVLLEGIQNIDK